MKDVSKMDSVNEDPKEKQEEIQEEKPKKILTKQAKCKYCNQMVIIQTLGDLTPEEETEIASEVCKCEEGEAARLQRYNRNTAYAWLDDQFKRDTYMYDLMQQSIDCVMEYTVERISIKQSDIISKDIERITNYTLKMTKSGRLEISQNTQFKRKDKFE